MDAYHFHPISIGASTAFPAVPTEAAQQYYTEGLGSTVGGLVGLADSVTLLQCCWCNFHDLKQHASKAHLGLASGARVAKYGCFGSHIWQHRPLKAHYECNILYKLASFVLDTVLIKICPIKVPLASATKWQAKYG